MKTTITFMFMLCLVGCTDENGTRRTLENSGYTDIHVGGYAMMMCGKDDTYSTEFTAKNTIGNTVSGTVCCGMLTKGCTIRF